MTFLNPFILFGLTAAAIPILLHLLNLRRLKTIEFSTLAFLKELQKTRIRRVKIRQWLLLFLRTLLVLLLVLAFSRPTLKGTLAGGFAERAKTSAVVLLDDSPSMTRTNDRGQLFLQAKAAVHGILESLSEGDEVCLIPASQLLLPVGADFAFQQSLPAVRSTLNDLQSSFAHPSFEEGLRAAAKLLSHSKNFNKEVYLISDGQQSQWGTSTAASADVIFSPDVHFFVAQLRAKDAPDAAVEDVHLPASLYEASKPFPLQFTIVQNGRLPSTPVASIFLNGNRSAQTAGAQSGTGRISASVSLVPQGSGLVRGKVVLEDDDVSFDNERYFALTIPPKVRVLVVGEREELSFVRVALFVRETDGAFDVTETTPARLSGLHLANADVVVVCGLGNRNGAAADAGRIAAFVERGGGLILFPDSQTDSAQFSGSAAALLHLPPVSGMELIRTKSDATIGFESYDARHPLFGGLFAEETPGRRNINTRPVPLESPAIVRAIRFSGGRAASPIITLTTGSAFLSEIRSGTGRTLVFSIAPVRSWSDLVTRSLFAPLLNSAVLYLSSTQSTIPSVAVDEPVDVRISRGSAGMVTVVRPNGTSVLTPVVGAGTGRLLKFSETTLPGIYTVHSAQDTLAAFVVNIHPGEFDARVVENPSADRLFKRLGIAASNVRTFDQADRTTQLVLESRLGTELWKFFLAAALLVAIAEMLVARDTPSGETS